jgi:WD40 repeat protein
MTRQCGKLRHLSNCEAIMHLPLRTAAFGWFPVAAFWLLSTCSVSAQELELRRSLVEREIQDGVLADVKFSPKGKTLACCRGDKIQLWDLHAARIIFNLDEHTKPVRSIAFSPDGKILASASWDKTIKLWDTSTGKNTATLRGHADLALRVVFSPDGKTLASADSTGKIKLWDVSTSKETATLEGHSYAVRILSLAFSPDGETLVSAAAFDTKIRFWNVSKGKQERAIDAGTGAVHQLAFSPDGKTLAFSGPKSTIILWDLAHDKKMAVLEGHTDFVMCLAFSPDGKTLVSGSGSKDAAIRLWDLASKKNTGTGKQPRWGQVNSVAFSPDGKSVAAAFAIGWTSIWDVVSDK